MLAYTSIAQYALTFMRTGTLNEARSLAAGEFSEIGGHKC